MFLHHRCQGTNEELSCAGCVQLHLQSSMPPVPCAHAAYPLWATDAHAIVQKWAQVGCWPPHGKWSESRADRKKKKKVGTVELSELGQWIESLPMRVVEDVAIFRQGSRGSKNTNRDANVPFVLTLVMKRSRASTFLSRCRDCTKCI